MKKAYTMPYAEKISFNYRDQVVASNGGAIHTTCYYEAQVSYGILGCHDQMVGAMNN